MGLRKFQKFSKIFFSVFRPPPRGEKTPQPVIWVNSCGKAMFRGEKCRLERLFILAQRWLMTFWRWCLEVWSTWKVNVMSIYLIWKPLRWNLFCSKRNSYQFGSQSTPFVVIWHLFFVDIRKNFVYLFIFFPSNNLKQLSTFHPPFTGEMRMYSQKAPNYGPYLPELRSIKIAYWFRHFDRVISW